MPITPQTNAFVAVQAMSTSEAVCGRLMQIGSHGWVIRDWDTARVGHYLRADWRISLFFNTPKEFTDAPEWQQVCMQVARAMLKCRKKAPL